MGDIILDMIFHPSNMTEVFFKSSSGDWIETESVNQEIEFGGYAIGYFEQDLYKAGTGFVCELYPQNSVDQECALVLTAAHVFLDNFVYGGKENN